MIYIDKHLALPFKGNRTYLHGTDMFSAILKEFNAENVYLKFELSFHRVVRKQLYLSSLPNLENVAAKGNVLIDGNLFSFYFCETDVEVDQRIEYAEELIVSKLLFDDKRQSIQIPVLNGFKDIELWVAANKALHLKLFPNLEGNWMFVKIKIMHVFSWKANGGFNLVLRANMLGKLTRSDIFQDNVKVAEIFFSLV